MRVKITNGKITAEAETLSDATVLLAYRDTATKGGRAHKRARKCKRCGKQCRYKTAHAKRCAV